MVLDEIEKKISSHPEAEGFIVAGNEQLLR